MAWSKPETQEIRAALRRYAPQIADQPLEFLAEGWAIWAFRAGDYVLRFPKRPGTAAEVNGSRRLVAELQAHLSTPISVPDVYGEHGPNDAPFAGHPFVPGVSLITAAQLLPASARGIPPEIRLAPTLGREIGVFLRELQSFPVDRALELGVPLKDGPAQRVDTIELYEDVIRRAFPLLSCEARTYAERRFDAFLNEPANFQFEPRLIHHDLDRQNLLSDPESGSLSGVIDWEGARIGNPAIDLWFPLIDFANLGIAGQLQDCIDAYGPFDRERAQAIVEFVDFLWPFHDILYGLVIEDQDFIEGGLRDLNASLPSGLTCD
ncbi:MAG TPA: phosphotransferase [Dehalococcoidia bacterium]|nr:phosphotransferase [Dehalococcoidia bacterium]